MNLFPSRVKKKQQREDSIKIAKNKVLLVAPILEKTFTKKIYTCFTEKGSELKIEKSSNLSHQRPIKRMRLQTGGHSIVEV